MNTLSSILPRTRDSFILMTLVCVVMWTSLVPARTVDPLPSWNDTAPKKDIIAFVEAVTKEGGPHFVPPELRIATFDNDGTLWTEKPYYTQLYFTVDRIKALAPKHPEWENEKPFKYALKDHMKGLSAEGKKGLFELLAAIHAGMTSEEFTDIASGWINSKQHPALKRKYADVVYQPMLELVAYLHAKGFKVFIVTGASQEFVRSFSQEVYGIPREQVIGSSVKTRFEMRNGRPVLVRGPKLFHFDKREGKAIGIQKYIGQRPIAAFGNSDGDLQMLQWTTAGDGLRLGAIIHHTDAKREVAYDSGLDKALEEAEQHGWIVVDMKKDWKTVFPEGK